MNKIVLFLFIVLSCGRCIGSQNLTTSISGKFQNRFAVPEKNLYAGLKLVFTTYHQNQIIENYLPTSRTEIVSDSIGQFKSVFTVPDSIYYLKIEIIKPSGEKNLDFHKALTDVMFVCKADDKLFLNIYMDVKGVVFDGKGALKMNCQYLANDLEMPRSAMLIFGNHSLSNETRDAAKHRIYNSLLNMKASIIESYRGMIENSILEIISNDAKYSVKYNFLRSMIPVGYKLAEGNLESNSINFFRKFMNDKSSLIFIDSSIVKSTYRCKFILNYAYILYREAEEQKKTNLTYSAWVVDFARSIRNPDLRDDVLLAVVFERLRTKAFEFSELLPQILAMVNDNQKVKTLKQYIATISPNDKIVPFEFIREDGSVLRSQDLKDKIILMDFWFTGCSPCMSIPPIMKRVIEKFKDRTDVVYLSISVDGSKELWKQGLQSGKYTTPGQLHVYTAGRSTHPYLLKYQMTSFPHVTLLGKNGTILSFNEEPRKDNGDNLIWLIENQK